MTNPTPQQPAGRPTPELTRPGRRPPVSGSLVRTELVVRILVRVYLGVLVMVLPWLTLWTQNNLFTYSRIFMVLSESGFVRGVISGLGLLNIVLALGEIPKLRLPRRTARP